FDFNKEEVLEILNLAREIKKKPEKFFDALKNKTLVMLFEKTSTRTRISFEAAMTQLGGHAIYWESRTSQLAKGEPLSDIGKVVSRYCQVIMARMYRQSDLEEFAKAASVPVLNGLTDIFHPCQSLGDLLTVKEKLGDLKGTVAFFGDCGFNMGHSTMITFSKIGMNVNLVCPIIQNPKGFCKLEKKKYQPNLEILKRARKEAEGKIKIIHNPVEGIKNADVVMTDTWVSMGQEKESKPRIKDLGPYQVNSELMRKANKGAIFMHCLPAYRGFEITKEVIDGPQSVVFDQAENRLHIQKAILLKLIK
ncbi:ornithine carbamoyltransferase, partial [Patescibacteria group bacterium]|nr:ornithine carbamoyltransferase [Patescibacteria group bacterium]